MERSKVSIVSDIVLENTIRRLCDLYQKKRQIDKELFVLKERIVEFADGDDKEWEVLGAGKVSVKHSNTVVITDLNRFREILGPMDEVFLSMQIKVRNSSELLKLAKKNRRLARLLRKKSTPRVNIRPEI